MWLGELAAPQSRSVTVTGQLTWCLLNSSRVLSTSPHSAQKNRPAGGAADAVSASLASRDRPEWPPLRLPDILREKYQHLSKENSLAHGL